MSYGSYSNSTGKRVSTEASRYCLMKARYSNLSTGLGGVMKCYKYEHLISHYECSY